MTLDSGNGIVHLVSLHSVSEVEERLATLLQSKGVPIFAVIDHSGEAARLGLTMPTTKVVIFGNPKAGTPLMIAVPDVALDLPLKILLAEMSDGTTRISYNSVAYLQARYGLDSDLASNISVIEQIANAIVK